MSAVLKLSIFVLAFGFFMEADPVSYIRQGSLTSIAEAIIGRPATLGARQRRRRGAAHDTALRGWRVQLLVLAGCGKMQCLRPFRGIVISNSRHSCHKQRCKPAF